MHKGNKRPRSAAGSRLAVCPCCNRSFHHMLINDHVEQCCLTNSAPQAAACLSIQHQAPSSSMPSPQPMRSLTFEEPKDAVACSAVVACPICGVEVGEADINRHLDETHAAADEGDGGGWDSSRGASSQSEVDGA
eukprot:scaffold77208_cov72-Phaeocystis_antarctica.AAC.1